MGREQTGEPIQGVFRGRLTERALASDFRPESHTPAWGWPIDHGSAVSFPTTQLHRNTPNAVRAVSYTHLDVYKRQAYTGINESKCDVIDIYFLEKELDKIAFRSAVSGTIWPMKDKSPGEMRLKNFQWLDSRRPKTKYELFE